MIVGRLVAGIALGILTPTIPVYVSDTSLSWPVLRNEQGSSVSSGSS